MNAQQLKNSILQEAIEGRLVPQDPNDEPASVLLDKIRKEKSKLVKEKKIKADKSESRIYRTEDGHWMEHFEDKKREDVCIDDEIDSNIPIGWEYCRFSSLYWLLTDGTHSTPKYTSEGIPFLSVKDMSSGKLSFVNTKYISLEEHSLISQRCNPQKGDLLLSKVGTTGIPLIIDSEREFSIFVSLALVKFFPDLLDSQFLIHLINSPLVQSQVKEETRGIGNKNWVLTAISRTLMVLPPLAEQKRIVAKIEELLPKVEKYGKAQEALDKLNEELPEQLKKSILQEAIEGHLVPQDPNDEPASALLDKIRAEKKRLVKEGKLKKKDLEEIPISEDEIPFKIPESWEWVRIKSIFNVCSARRVHEKDWRTSGIPFYRAREIGKLADNGFVDNDLFIDQQLYDEFSKSGVPKGGDLMITAVGTLGKIYIVKEREIFYYKDGSVLCMENNWKINPKYAKFVIESPVFINQYIGESQGTTVATLTMVRVNQYLFPLPPLAEQHRIVAKLEQLLGAINKLNE